MVANTTFTLHDASIESFVQLIKERFIGAIDMQADLICQRHHSLSIAYDKYYHDALQKRLWNAPIDIVIEDNRLILKLIDGTDPQILCNAIDNWQNLELTIT
jgi:hypothetical protein